jgi:bleomycin hydrolase
MGRIPADTFRNLLEIPGMKRFLSTCFFSHIIFLSFGQDLSPSAMGILPLHVSGCTPVKDQYMSSTCWSFASNSFIESEILRMGKKETDLSEMYTARWVYIQKIRTHLRVKGQNYFTPGGQFHDVQWVLKNYGMVPENVYNGKPAGESRHDHSLLDTVMNRYVSQMVADGKNEPTPADWEYINHLLDDHLGKLPSSFRYDNKMVNPQAFLKEELAINPDDYLEITSYTHHPWYVPFVLENKYNWNSARYMNVPLSDFIRITEEALDKGYTVLWNGDVKEPGFHFWDALALLPVSPEDLVAERQRTFADSSSYLDHMMHIVGKTTDSKKQRWYYVKNSWGKANSEGGYLYMSSDYFAIKTAAIVVHKNAIPADIRKKMRL